MKPRKKLRITEADFMLANRRAARLEEIEQHGKPVSFRKVLQHFTDWCGEMDYTIYSWSDNDLLQILQETALKGIDDTPQLSYMYHHWKDFQQEYCGLFPMDHVMSLEKAVNYCGIEFKGRAHDGQAGRDHQVG